MLLLRLFVLCASLLLAHPLGAQTLRIFHIDVEQADAVVIVMPNGKTLLIDSGNNGHGRRIKNAMDAAGVAQIDVFVSSHYHIDHYGGVDELVEQLGIRVLESFDRGDKACCLPASKKAENAFKAYMRTVGEDARPLRPGDTINLDPLVTVSVISSGGAVPGTSSAPGQHENDFSVSLLLTFGGFRAFFGGDIEAPTEKKISDRDLVMNVDLYKANHHGSDTSSSLPFLEDPRPSVIVVSNGSHGGHKHPKQTILSRYALLTPAPAVFQTNRCLHPPPCGNVALTSIADPESSADEDGTITVTVDAATGSYTLSFGTTTRTFMVKNAAAPVVVTTATSVVIRSVLPNPAGDDIQLEEVTVQNKAIAPLSLVGWTLSDRSGATWNLTGTIAPGASRTFRRNGQAMSLNNAGDDIVLIDDVGMERDSFEYPASAEGVVIVTGH